MRIKTIIALSVLISASVFFAGCVGDDGPVIEETETEETETEETETEETETIPVINETSEEVEEIPVEEPEVVVEEEETVVSPQPHPITLRYYQARPSTFEINRSETVVWRNSQDPKRLLTLVSEDGLWEDTNLVYGRTFVYTFNESGTYNFSVIGQLRMSGSITVR